MYKNQTTYIYMHLYMNFTSFYFHDRPVVINHADGIKKDLNKELSRMTILIYSYISELAMLIDEFM